MRQYLMLAIALISVQAAYAANSAHIRLKVNADTSHNRYFVCVPDIGCLSIKAAKRGKVFTIHHPIEMNTVFITDTNTLKVYNQGLPASCDVKVDQNKTLTIFGQLVVSGSHVKVQQLHCSVS